MQFTSSPPLPPPSPLPPPLSSPPPSPPQGTQDSEGYPIVLFTVSRHETFRSDHKADMQLLFYTLDQVSLQLVFEGPRGKGEEREGREGEGGVREEGGRRGN